MKPNPLHKPEIVAHRGFAAEYPENSLSAFQAAIDCGCRFLELDIQLTQDKLAIVIHDTTLSRTGESAAHVFENSWQTLQKETIGEKVRFSDKFKNEKLISLHDFSWLLKRNPSVHAFVEIKEECIAFFGAGEVLNAVCQSIEGVMNQCSIISFDASVLFEAKQQTAFPLGYVIHQYDGSHLEIAQKLSPEIIICNYKKIPDEENSLWQGSWDWFLYEITEPELALKWARRGVKYIETMQIKSMLKSIT